MTDSIRRLYDGVRAARGQDPARSRTARLLQAGPRKIAKKVAEEAAEVALEVREPATGKKSSAKARTCSITS
jgi:phosphoribosyl-ATP pyrophosphohydrolase